MKTAIEKIGSWFSDRAKTAEIQAAKRLSGYQELVDRLARVSVTGEGDPPDDAAVDEILTAAGKTFSQMEAAVIALVRTERLKSLAASAEAKRSQLVVIAKQWEEREARYRAESILLKNAFLEEMERYRNHQARLQVEAVEATQAFRQLESENLMTTRELDLNTERDDLAKQRTELIHRQRASGRFSDGVRGFRTGYEIAVATTAATFEQEPDVIELASLTEQLRAGDCTGHKAAALLRKIDSLKLTIGKLKRAHHFAGQISAIDDKMNAIAAELTELAADRNRPHYSIGEPNAEEAAGELQVMESNTRRRNRAVAQT